MEHHRAGRWALTLMEVLVTISIIGMLMALLLPAVQQAREAARRAQCQSSLKQLVLSVHGFHSAHARFPPGRFRGSFGFGPSSRAWSWEAELLPFVERNDLFKMGSLLKTRLNQSVATPYQISIFLCPSGASPSDGPRLDAADLLGLPAGESTYKAVSGANWGDDKTQPVNVQIATAWRNLGTNGSYDGLDEGDGAMYRSDYDRPIGLAKVRDGSSQSFLLGEDVPAANLWLSWPYSNNAYGTCAIPPNVFNYDPIDWPNTWSFRSRHPGGLNFAMADGGVRFISDAVDLRVYRALATIAGQEMVPGNAWQ